MTSDPFVRALTSVVDGTRQLEDFARVVVAGAVEDAFLRASRDHGISYSALVDAHLEDIVDRHATAGGDGGACGACRGRTTTGRRCPRRGLVRGYCRAHAEQLARDQETAAQTTAYAQTVRATSPEKSEVASALARAGAEAIDSKAFVLAGEADVFDLL